MTSDLVERGLRDISVSGADHKCEQADRYILGEVVIHEHGAQSNGIGIWKRRSDRSIFIL